MNSNDKNGLVQLPFILLKKIIDYLDNLDKICFSLLCKQLFENRQRYLYIPLVVTNDTIAYAIKGFQLKSFSNQIESFNIENSNHTKKTILKVAQFLDHPILLNTKRISPGIVTIVNQSDFNALTEKDIPVDIVEIALNCFEYGGSILDIPAIDRIHSLECFLSTDIDYRLPSNLTYLAIHKRVTFGPNAMLPPCLETLMLVGEHRFAKGFLPNTLKNLILMCECILDRDTLPHGLECLEIVNDSYDYPIAKGVLPSTLKHLTLFSYSGDLICFGDNESIDNTGIEQQSNDTYIPSTLESLKLGSFFNTTKENFNSILPTQLRSLELLSSFTEVIDCSQIPSRVTTLKLESYPDSIKLNRIPHGIKSLDIYYLESPLPAGSLPDTLESLSIRGNTNWDWRNQLSLSGLNPSIRSLSLSSIYCNSISLQSLPKSVVNLEFFSDLQFNLKLRRLDHPSLDRFILFLHLNQGAFVESSDLIDIQKRFEQILENKTF
ncbi:hypothetical protein PPL_06014 [Heterostelium album PN500]|uniref:F-box domain-containing protein n=1 Tax=Heterostelium pallidum (strain ATCC 26659 / Pp 5 / PN500) TaxID=670386 RepID=D3BBZ4_HETP5|nr:hypothetical protein PPL_06014 [Heterostelium album PN500]EFA81177.1 hypothetical protein PPL_06014 [Heterostelium album PN500]|eukprot:XP_020433295.1 hypothetical protein PPL_06014 [Heterostelium album PN500]